MEIVLCFFLVVPHITDAIQEWVERVANQSVTEDGTKPEVSIHCCLLWATLLIKQRNRNFIDTF